MLSEAVLETASECPSIAEGWYESWYFMDQEKSSLPDKQCPGELLACVMLHRSMVVL